MRAYSSTNDQTNPKTNPTMQRAAIAVAVSLAGVLGCSSTPDEATGSVGQATSTTIYDVVPQDVTAVWWIAAFNPLDHVDSLCNALPECKTPCDIAAAAGPFDVRAIDDWGACQTMRKLITANLTALAGSANFSQNPQSLYSNAQWNALKSNKDYRGFLKISNMAIRCENGQTIPWDDGAYYHPVMEQSPGYTLRVESEWEQGYPRPLDVTNGGSCVDFRQTVKSRLGNDLQERAFLWFTLGLNAPFIYADANVHVCCDGSVTVDIRRSTFPTMAVFDGGRLMSRVAQANLEPFMISPGAPPPRVDLEPNGVGTTAPGGQGVTYATTAYVVDENAGVSP